jgi:hypothetical protein
VGERFRSFLFAVGDPLNLGFARFVVFAVMGIRFWTASYVAAAEIPDALLQPPLGFGWALPFVPRDPAAVERLALLLRVAALAAAVGLFTRLTTVVATVAATLLFVIPHLFGHVGHDRHHFIWFAAILAASPCGDALSLDGWWRRRRGAPAAPPAARYGFPLRAILLTMGVAYFFSGFWKLASCGPAWFASDNLANLVVKAGYIGIGARPEWVRTYSWLAPVGGAVGVAFELSFLALVVTSRLGRALALAMAFVFHLGVYLLLGISFAHLLYCYFAFIDVAALRRLATGAATPLTPARDTRVPLASRIVAALVVLGVGAFGAARIGNGWPFAGYPRFDTLHTPLLTSYVLEARQADGRVVRLHDGELGGPPLGRHLFNILRANQNRVPGLEEADGREARWRAACTFFWAENRRLQGATGVRFILEDLDLSEATPRRLRERVLFECAPPGPRG